MCYSAFLACVSEMICDPADTCAAQISSSGFLWQGRTAVPVSLLTVNIEFVFAKHDSGSRNTVCLCVAALVQRGDAEQMAGWDGWE